MDGSGGGLPAKVKKSRSNGSLKKAEPRKSLSLEAAQLEIQQQQHKTLSRHVVVGKMLVRACVASRSDWPVCPDASFELHHRVVKRYTLCGN